MLENANLCRSGIQLASPERLSSAKFMSQNNVHAEVLVRPLLPNDADVSDMPKLEHALKDSVNMLLVSTCATAACSVDLL